MTVSTHKKPATLDDLYAADGKAELRNGELIFMAPTGDDPGFAGDEVFVSLRSYSRQTGEGRAIGDNKGFVVNLPNRKSFSPDAAFFTGQRTGMRFLQGAPLFAVEVRSENDYGVRAERDMAEKRTDYFAAGTLVVWDVDLQSDITVRKYRADSPEAPDLFRRCETADAEPAVPGWTMPVDDLFQ